jgi:hypothetical protein
MTFFATWLTRLVGCYERSRRRAMLAAGEKAFAVTFTTHLLHQFSRSSAISGRTADQLGPDNAYR